MFGLRKEKVKTKHVIWEAFCESSFPQSSITEVTCAKSFGKYARLKYTRTLVIKLELSKNQMPKIWLKLIFF